MIAYDDWRKERIEARIWSCGDDECACHQPLIQRITPNIEAGYPWIRRETLWAGTFVSFGIDWGDPELPSYDDLIAELRQACEERRVPMPRADADA